MMTIILQSYFTLLLSVSFGCLSVFVLGIYLIVKMINRDFSKKSPTHAEVNGAASATDLTAIAGDDLVATQLDLARAYIEINQKGLAQTILQAVISQGNDAQQEEARHLLSYIG